jgi:hypothetical protein
MIDETELTDLLSAAAADYGVPEDGRDRILHAAASGKAPEVEPWWRTHRLAVACAVIIVVVGSTVVIRQLGHNGDEGKTTALRESPTGAAAPVPPSVPSPVIVGSADQAGPINGLPSDRGIGAGAAGAAGGAAAAKGAVGQQGPGGGPAATPQSQGRSLGDTAKVVETGSVQVEVRRGAVGSTMVSLTSLATGFNGYVADTRTAEGGDDPTGTMTLRVPAASFDDVVARVRAMGKVNSITSHGQDVTAEYSDIKARLTALNATRSQLLTILQKATAIGDVLAVQDRINQVQTEIEQLQGQQKVLDDQTSYAALSVDVSQQGAKLGPPQQRAGLAKAWYDAHHGFTNGVDWLIARSGTALLVLLILAALAAVARVAWVLLRRRLV